MVALCFLYILIWVPETKGLTIEEITRILNPGSSFDHKPIADEPAQTKEGEPTENTQLLSPIHTNIETT